MTKRRKYPSIAQNMKDLKALFDSLFKEKPVNPRLCDVCGAERDDHSIFRRGIEIMGVFCFDKHHDEQKEAWKMT